jgi:hypothetical protein
MDIDRNEPNRIDKGQWIERLANIHIPKHLINKLVMNFFLVEGIVKNL